MYSKHKFYCQHTNENMEHTEYIEIGLKSKSKLLVKYKDTEYKQTIKVVLNKKKVSELIEILKSSLSGDEYFESPVVKSKDCELYIENDFTCVSPRHILAFEDDNSYECLHLTRQDIALMIIVVSDIYKWMNE
ncbi:gp212 [Bacillus phage W.Ph.]|uniref:Gp212 n=1 Tax=Bacillus phage W.Ph. TaxID=764595 RepID=G9B1W3_9CAUD|nr:gp212 [Bacillus phage W.Ph.]ADH03358.1 gp212 [Bacillus phage W.Ph.]